MGETHRGKLLDGCISLLLGLLGCSGGTSNLLPGSIHSAHDITSPSCHNSPIKWIRSGLASQSRHWEPESNLLNSSLLMLPFRHSRDNAVVRMSVPHAWHS